MPLALLQDNGPLFTHHWPYVGAHNLPYLSHQAGLHPLGSLQFAAGSKHSKCSRRLAHGQNPLLPDSAEHVWLRLRSCTACVE
jgi:hypothetical protein